MAIHGLDNQVSVFVRGTNNRIETASRPVVAVTGPLRDTVELAVRGLDNTPWAMTFVGNNVACDWHPVAGGMQSAHPPALVGSLTRTVMHIVIDLLSYNSIWGKQVV